MKEEFATPRRTVIVDQEGEIEDEDLIQREDMVVTVSHAGYIKRVPLSTYRAQHRGGKGRSGMQTRDEDFVTRLFVASTHTPVLFFSSRGQVYKEKVWRLPLAAPQARGKALINILPLEQGETITTIMPLPEDETTWGELDVMFATTSGTVRRNKLSDFVDVRPSGIIAMKLDEGEAIVDVAICTEKDDVLLTTAGGQCIRFPVPKCACSPAAPRMGVRGIALAEERQSDLAVDPAPRRCDRRGARRLSQARQRGAPRPGATRRGRPRRRPISREAAGAHRARRAALCRNVGGASSSCSRCRSAATASAPRPTSTASPAAAAKASSPWTIVSATAAARQDRPLGSFPVEETDQVMLVTDAGKLIRYAGRRHPHRRPQRRRA